MFSRNGIDMSDRGTLSHLAKVPIVFNFTGCHLDVE